MLIQAGNLTLSRNAQNGLLSGTTLGSVTDAWTYNGLAKPISYTVAYNDAPLFEAQYTRDKLGRLTQKTETVMGVTTTFSYTYDLAGRLSGVSQSSVVTPTTYSYDSNSNRLSPSPVGWGEIPLWPKSWVTPKSTGRVRPKFGNP